jgi:hypothetical protein
LIDCVELVVIMVLPRLGFKHEVPAGRAAKAWRRLRIVREQIKEIEQERLRKIEAETAAEHGHHSMIRLSDVCAAHAPASHRRDGRSRASLSCPSKEVLTTSASFFGSQQARKVTQILKIRETA